MPTSLHRCATSWAANMAAYGEDSSRSALTFIPPVTRTTVSLPLNSKNILGQQLDEVNNGNTFSSPCLLPIPNPPHFHRGIWHSRFTLLATPPTGDSGKIEQTSICIGAHEPEIGNVYKSIIKWCENTGNTEDQFTYKLQLAQYIIQPFPNQQTQNGGEAEGKKRERKGEKTDHLSCTKITGQHVGHYLHGSGVPERCSPPSSQPSFPLEA